MQNYSLFEKIGILFSIIKTSPLFIVSFIIGIILITMMFLDLKTTKKIREKLGPGYTRYGSLDYESLRLARTTNNHLNHL